MNVERQLQIAMAVLAALGTLLLGLGQKHAWLPVFGAFAALISVYLADMARVLVLHRNLANVAALVAVVISVRDFIPASRDDQLLAIANLLIYLQLVLLYQRKSDRIYWQLVVLSLLQVVVAAALNSGFEFGLLLVFYLVVAMLGMFLFFIRRETRQTILAEGIEEGEWWKHWTSESEEESAGEEHSSAPSAATRTPIFSQVALPIHPDDPAARPLPGWSMLREVSSLTLVTLVFAAVLFYIVPRTQGQAGRQASSGNAVGYSSEVTFNDSTKIAVDDAPALRLTLSNYATGEPLVLPEPLFLQGAVLTDYTPGTDAKFAPRPVVIPFRRSSNGSRMPGRRLNEPPTLDLVRVSISVEQPEKDVVFGIYPAYRLLDTDPRILYSNAYDRLVSGGPGVVPNAGNQAPLQYTLGTTALSQGRQHRFRSYAAMKSAFAWQMPESERRQLLQLDREAMPRLTKLAEQIVAGIPEHAENYRLLQCRAVEDYFRQSQEYQYTLDFTGTRRNVELDPIEDFLLNHRRGNCRYFAAAATLALRAIGVPARMVAGFKGGDYNSVGRYYAVKQRHAHAWVEAYLEPLDVPAGALPRGESAEGGAWYRIDPTPVEREAASETLAVTVFDQWDELLDFAHVLWQDYVVDLNFERQQQAIFRPLMDNATVAVERLFEPRGWQNWFARLAAGLGLAPDGWFAQSWPLWLALLAAPLALVAGWGAWVLGPAWLRYFFTGRYDDPHARGAQRSRVEFYDRLEQILAEQGLRRGSGQTPREFAQQVAADLHEEPSFAAVLPLIRQITETYYRVRYSDYRPGWDELAELERDLVVIARQFAEREAAPSTGPR